MTNHSRRTMDIIAGSALSSRATLEATYMMTEDVLRRGVPGDLVECGVFAGAQIAAMALAFRDHFDDSRFPLMARDRFGWPLQCGKFRIHLFDSFTGIPQCGPHDEQFLASGKQAGESACSRDQVEENLKRWELPKWLFVWHEGLFEDTISVCRIGKIALLRLDGDLYESTKACMPLLDLVSPGGWVIVDDYHLTGCRKAIHEKVVPGPIYWIKD